MNTPTGYSALDLVGFTDKGDYSGSATYVKNDLVHYNSKVWKCKLDDTSGQTPASGTYWDLWIDFSDSLEEMTDVDISSPANGDVLEYDSTSGKWKNSDVIGDVKQALSDEVSARATLGAHNLLENKASSQANITVNSDKTITLDTGGSATESVTNLTIIGGLGKEDAFNAIKDKALVLSGVPESGSTSNSYYIYANLYNRSTMTYSRSIAINSATPTQTFTLDTEYVAEVKLYVASGQTVSNKVFKPMICDAKDASTEYQPYAMTNRELTDELTVKTGSIIPAGTQTSNFVVKQQGKVVNITGYMDGLDFTGGTRLDIGTVSGVDLPSYAPRTIGAVADYAYIEPSLVAYVVIENGHLYARVSTSVTSKSFYFDMTYIVG